MEIEHVSNLEEIADKMQELYKEIEKLSKYSEILKLIQKTCTNIEDNQGVTLKLLLTLDEVEDGLSLPYYEMGLNCLKNETPYFFEGTSSLATYIYNGEAYRIPHDRCPACWGVWDFKFKYDSCPECGITFGKEVKILLDSNVCPSCEEGEISSRKLHCSKCGFEADPDKFIWG